MKADLSGVPETMLIPLWARAEESRKPKPIFRDDKAVEMLPMALVGGSTRHDSVTKIGSAVEFK